MYTDRPEPASKPDGDSKDNFRITGAQYSTLALQIGLSDTIHNRPFRLKITSSSMSPHLAPGDFIDIEFTSPENLKRGDIVVFQTGDELITHRLVSTSRSGWLTKGDALPFFDPRIERSKLLGRAVAFEHDGTSTNFSGWRWRMFNRTAGQLYFWEGCTARLAESLFPYRRGEQPPAALSNLAHLAVGLLRLPAKILLKLLAL